MKLEGYKLIFVVMGLIGVLLIATPALAGDIHLPSGAQFSELYLLGTNQMAENYPSNIAVGENYSVYVGVGNQLGSSAYYVLYVKFGNETDQMPNDTLSTPSSLQPLYEYRFSIQNSLDWENLLTFSVSNASISGKNSQINTLQLNGVAFNVDKPAIWDSKSATFKYQLLFELWIYNSRTSAISYNDRFVDLQLNLTRTL
ncbi:MAG: DUF1616 domain-containing protein [Candidatus Bathyarchaeia archaeon]|jgi:uncharacterized membrane protein